MPPPEPPIPEDRREAELCAAWRRPLGDPFALAYSFDSGRLAHFYPRRPAHILMSQYAVMAALHRVFNLSGRNGGDHR